MTDEPEIVIPLDRLPPGFAERVEAQSHSAATPLPAATVVLVRDGSEAPEILLLERHRASGFVPGAYVFPGGRVDEGDAADELRAMCAPPAPPEAAYWFAAVREAFEETGVLLARGESGEAVADATQSVDVAAWREALLSNRAQFAAVLGALRARLDLDRMVYCAHWITPVAEPRRYDTRFFIAELPHGSTVRIEEREMSAAVWVTAAAAVEGFRDGSLPMVFPTVKTIQRLAPYRTVDGMLAAFRSADVPATMPRLVRTADGVGIVLD
ncbi:MAG TPA: NUDIX domain-containing protein [Longimicrobiales bacterium]|nr:NUDIX domain-containing protein [Longimicrobiales bacterium]